MLLIYMLLMTLVCIQGNDLCVPKLYKNITYCFSGVLNFLIKQLVGAMSLNP